MGGETESSVSGWTVDTLREYAQRQIDDLRILLDERYGTQTKAVDAAFAAAALAVQSALLAAEKAVVKAEGASDKRFESVNEFRAQLADITATLITRAEADAKFAALAEKVDGQDERFRAQIEELTQKIRDTEQRLTQRGWLVLGQVAGLAGVAVAVVVAVR